MVFFQKLLALLDVSMEVPGMYGWFHLASLAVTALATVCFCRRIKTPEQLRRLMRCTAVTVILLELYKQVNFSFSYTGTVTFDYAWYSFPFQFCSTPMYVGLLAGLTRRGRIHRAACAYLASYALFAGLSVMAYPNTVFIDTVGINIQTMVCHGSMVAVGICLLYSGYVKPRLSTAVKALPVFAVCVGLAAVLNEAAFQTGLLETDTFNMFFISPYCPPSLPVYSQVQEALAFPWCLALYVLGFTLAAGLVLLAVGGLKSLFETASGCRKTLQTEGLGGSDRVKGNR